MARRAVLPAVLVGIGVAGTLDEVVFHQLLAWHHLVDRGERTDLVSDGLLHLASTLALVGGLVGLWRGRAERRPGFRRELLGGVLAGFGGFNLFDGTVQHLLLDLHAVRPGAGDQLPYDLAWNGVSVAVLAAGLAVLRARRGR